MALDKAGILAALQLAKETVEIPGGEVIISALSAPDYLSMWESPNIFKADGAPGPDGKPEVDTSRFSALMLARCIVDEAGNRIFADEEAEQLRAGFAPVFQHLAGVANRLNGFSGDEAKN